MSPLRSAEGPVPRSVGETPTGLASSQGRPHSLFRMNGMLILPHSVSQQIVRVG